MPVVEFQPVGALLPHFEIIPILVPSELIEPTYFPHSYIWSFFSLLALALQERPFQQEIRNWWMVARVLAENTSPIIIVALVGLSEERVEWL